MFKGKLYNALTAETVKHITNIYLIYRNFHYSLRFTVDF